MNGRAAAAIVLILAALIVLCLPQPAASPDTGKQRTAYILGGRG